MAASDRARWAKRTARLAGLLYLVVFVLGVFGELFVRQRVIVPGDAAATAANILASESLFRLGFVTDLVRQMALVFLPLVLYRLLRPVGRDLSLVTAVLALISAPVGLVILMAQPAALLVLSGATYLTAFDGEQLGAHAMLLLQLREQGGFVLQFLGFWVIPLGYLVWRSHFLPRALGILLIIAGLGYVVDAVAFFLAFGASIAVSQITFLGEVLFMLWLLVMGADGERWEVAAAESA